MVAGHFVLTLRSRTWSLLPARRSVLVNRRGKMAAQLVAALRPTPPRRFPCQDCR